MPTLYSSDESSEQAHFLNEILGHITCPKCHKEQAKSAECIYCGIVFSKFSKVKERAEQKSVEEQMGLTDIKYSGMLKKVIICFLILRLFMTCLSCIDDVVNPFNY